MNGRWKDMTHHILVVEDEKDLLNLLEIYLTNEGFTVETFDHGDSAYEKIEQGDYDLAILDVMLPGKDGFELCKKIRQYHLYPSTRYNESMQKTAPVESEIRGLSINRDTIENTQNK